MKENVSFPLISRDEFPLINDIAQSKVSGKKNHIDNFVPDSANVQKWSPTLLFRLRNEIQTVRDQLNTVKSQMADLITNTKLKINTNGKNKKKPKDQQTLNARAAKINEFTENAKSLWSIINPIFQPIDMHYLQDYYLVETTPPASLNFNVEFDEHYSQILSPQILIKIPQKRIVPISHILISCLIPIKDNETMNLDFNSYENKKNSNWVNLSVENKIYYELSSIGLSDELVDIAPIGFPNPDDVKELLCQRINEANFARKELKKIIDRNIDKINEHNYLCTDA